MPKKTKSNSSLLDAPVSKSRRGRPRRAVAQEALCPFEQSSVEKVKKLKSREKKSPPPEDNSVRRRLFPTTSDRNYTADEVEFMNALEEFKRASGRTFPTCCEILGVLKSLGYEKVVLQNVAAEMLP